MRVRLRLVLAAVAMAAAAGAAAAAPQFRVSPGPLSQAHTALEGLTGCVRCHEPGGGPASARCLACHKPIAERMAGRRGVHRAVTGECGTCHREHRGADADIRPIDERSFDHAAETGFVLEGTHARTSRGCASCHRPRSFLAVTRACASCHEDRHRGALGDACSRCHDPSTAFKRARETFDHSRAAFALTGRHREVACEKCHATGRFRGLAYQACSACHSSPHSRPLGPSCAGCHVTDRWATREFDHDRSGFPLEGAHRGVACARCHAGGVRQRLEHERCGACHQNPHLESIRKDCRACHSPAGFKGATLDHQATTGFALAGKHRDLPCRQCHTRLTGGLATPAAGAATPGTRVVDFGGLSPACAGCHQDRHRGEFGARCESCHLTDTFKAAGFTHPGAPEPFFAGRHAGLACARCHVRPGGAASPVKPSPACQACHADPHLGQVGAACERCHAVDAEKFAPARFSHAAASFVLVGRHAAVACAKCHQRQAGAFPSGAGTAVRLRPLSHECGSCHADPHLGQVNAACATCHTEDSFLLKSYRHAGLDPLFSVATHGQLPCRSCHKVEFGQFPAGRGRAVRLKPGRACLDCH